MLAAMNRCESTFNAMMKTEEGIGVVKQTLFDLAQGQPEHASHKTTGSEHLKVSTEVLDWIHKYHDQTACKMYCYSLLM